MNSFQRQVIETVRLLCVVSSCNEVQRLDLVQLSESCCPCVYVLSKLIGILEMDEEAFVLLVFVFDPLHTG